MVGCEQVVEFDVERAWREALTAHQQGVFAKAEQGYRLILEHCPLQPEAALYLGLLYQATGRHTEAAELFGEAAARYPEEAEFHVQLATLRAEQGRLEEAVASLCRAAEQAPANPRIHYNLGTLYLRGQRPALAAEALARSLALAPEDPDCLFNLAIAHTRLGETAKARVAYEQALALAPDDPDILYNLALLHKRDQRLEEAAGLLEQLVADHPGYAAAYSHLGELCVRLGRLPRAVVCFEKLLELGHDQAAARHMLAALTGKTPKAPPTGYVSRLFDQYADHFEQELVDHLQYEVPTRLAEFLAARDGVARGQRLGVLDLGCGTGLAGEVFRPLASRLVGVDLSRAMVAEAGKKGIYDQLVVTDLQCFCRESGQRFDLVVAADVLVYLGELASFFEAVAHCLASEGVLLFSTENHPGEGFVLRSSGRFAHSPDYVRQCAVQAGLAVTASQRCNLRQEQGCWIEGDLHLVRGRPFFPTDG